MSEDYRTNSVEAAEEYEKARAKEERDDMEDFDEYEEEQEEDCGCSDPSCPCNGHKRGCL